jgi:hypothetical protein
MPVTTIRGANNGSGSSQIAAGSISNADIHASAAIALTKLAEAVIQADGGQAFTGEQSMGGFKLTNLGTPSGPADAATKAYVDAYANGLDLKASVRVATTTAGTLGTSFQGGVINSVVDGIALATGDRILIKNQASGAENGIYTVNATGTPTRATDANDDVEVTGGMFVFVEEGTTNSDSGWVLTNNGAITVGTTALTFTQFSGAGQITAGNGLTKTGNTLDAVGTTNRIVVNADSIDIGTDVVTLTGSQTLTNKSIVATQLTGTIAAAQMPAHTGDVTSSAGSVALTIANSAVTLGKMANLAANSVIGNATGSAATPTAVGMTAAPTASNVVIRDANANARFNNTVRNLTTTATAAGTTTLTVSSSHTQQFTGTTTQTVVLPDATTLTVGHSFLITNRSTGVVTVNANGGGLIQTMAASSQLLVTAVTVGTAAGTWDAAYSITNAGSGGGTVTTVSVVNANGFNGSVSNPTTTPAITVSTTVTGVLKGNGTAISAAAAGTDYLAPSNVVTRETPSGAVNGINTGFSLANTPIAGTEQVFLNGLLQEPGAGNDYTISGTAITYLTAPLTNDKIRVTYLKV